MGAIRGSALVKKRVGIAFKRGGLFNRRQGRGGRLPLTTKNMLFLLIDARNSSKCDLESPHSCYLDALSGFQKVS